MLGCLPGYNTIGVFAPILLTLIRMVQGLAVGGQLVGSMVTVTENSPKKQVQDGPFLTLSSLAFSLSLSLSPTRPPTHAHTRAHTRTHTPNPMLR